MPATLKQVIKTKDGTVLQPSDITVDQKVVFVCDSRRCGSRHGVPTEIVWDEGEATKDIKALPDAFFRLIKIMPNPMDQTEALGFCSAQCGKDWLTYEYQPPRTGRAILKEAEDKQMVLPFPEAPLNPITAQSDATGFVEENLRGSTEVDGAAQ